MSSAPEKYRGHHPLDALDAKRIRLVAIKHDVMIDLKDSSEKAIAKRQRLGKLRRIAKMEAEACGEEMW